MFGRKRRRRKLRTHRHPELAAGVGTQEAQEAWVALPLEELAQNAVGPNEEVAPPRPKPGPPPAPRYPSLLVLPMVVIIAVAGLFVIQSAIRNTLTQSWIADASMRSLESATRFAAANGLAWHRLGLFQSNDSHSEAAIASLRQASSLAPSASAPRLALALELERNGQLAEAETVYLDAARVDAGFDVRWSTANYYLRKGDWNSVWTWLHSAILADPSRLPVAASLGWRANAASSDILLNAIPDEPDSNQRYFAYLYDIGQLDAMREAWPRFSATLSEDEVALATSYIDRLISAGLVVEATNAWNFLSERLLIPHAPLGASENRFLSNPLFATAPSAVGFDWQVGDGRGVAWSHLPAPAGQGAIEFRLSGAQESRLVLLSQFMPTAPGNYSFEFEIATQGMPTRTGMGWLVRDAYSREILEPFVSLNNAEGFWDSHRITFTVPESSKATVLEFYYQSGDVGLIRRGAVRLRGLELEWQGGVAETQ